jgi:hypothetical protein
MLRNINLLNILLASALLFFLFSYVLPIFTMSIKYTLPEGKSLPADNSVEVEKPDDIMKSFLTDYVIIANENLFHPERKIPEEVEEASSSQKPDFVLYGTLITGDKKIAFIEDKISPQSTPGRGKRQLALLIGGSLSGYTLREVYHEKVVMAKGDEKIEIAIIDQSGAKKRTPEPLTKIKKPAIPNLFKKAR